MRDYWFLHGTGYDLYFTVLYCISVKCGRISSIQLTDISTPWKWCVSKWNPSLLSPSLSPLTSTVRFSTTPLTNMTHSEKITTKNLYCTQGIYHSYLIWHSEIQLTKYTHTVISLQNTFFHNLARQEKEMMCNSSFPLSIAGTLLVILRSALYGINFNCGGVGKNHNWLD